MFGVHSTLISRHTIHTILLGRCPKCYKGKLFSGLLDFVSVCDQCGLDVEKEDVGDAHTYVTISIVGVFVTILACLVEVYFHWPMWLHLSVWMVVSLTMSIYLLRVSKSLFFLMQFKYIHRHE